MAAADQREHQRSVRQYFPKGSDLRAYGPGRLAEVAAELNDRPVAACTGLALGLLDQWLAGHDTEAPARLATMTRLPAGHWTGERAGIDILTLARKGRAFASLDSLIARQGGQHVLYGSALVLTAALQSWARHTETPLIDLARAAVR